ncbi:MAG TPA: hypothetical protein P5186_24080 [Candidatus Paceibacterota bacterium]|nr:hypothetical protein [Verrucomicrobiota bacterium]HRY51140.1 hypothetical protein [Candidatus Paceibacterota bacterium]HSA01010.1 hypothetical protein [Candidatus Paceibacterota bacterium]
MKFFDQDRFVQMMADRPLLRMLFFEFWFRMAFLAFLVLVVFLGLFLPKIWRASPPNFKPIIRVSGLDKVQAWSLRRTAIRASEAGRNTEAAYAWQSAIQHNPADPDLLRGALRQSLKAEINARNMTMAVNQANWLLRLTATNQTDVVLAAQVYQNFQLYDQVLSLLEPRADHLTPDLEATYLKAMFNSGMIGQFASRWEKNGGAQLKDPELPYYHAAYLAAWGPTSTRVEGRRILDTAQDIHRPLADRMLLAVCVQQRDLAGYTASLERLRQAQRDRLNDHIGYWYLLGSQGQSEEAKRLAKAYNRPPASAMETVRLAAALQELTLNDLALQVLQQYVPQFDYTITGWVVYAQLLIRMEKWEELRSLALRIRQESAARDSLTDYTYYLEGRAELGLGKRGLAEDAFSKSAEFEFNNPGLGLAIASDLIKLGFPDHAKRVLSHLEKAGAQNAQYWLVAARTAHELKQSDWLLEATSRAYQLNPKPLLVRNYYAAALLIRREKPAEAVRITLELLQEYPQVVGLRLNHCLALLLNGRPKDAELLLAPIRHETLNAEELNAYYLAKSELHYQLGQFKEAQQAMSQIDRQRLFSSQLEWLNSMTQEMSRSGKS